jgi:hypothetical protein
MYTRESLTGAPANPQATLLADIPADAPYIGDHTIYQWDVERQAWVGYDTKPNYSVITPEEERDAHDEMQDV